MKTYLNITKIEPKRLMSTDLYSVTSSVNGSHLGYISFYPAWRKYVFQTPESSIILDASCLMEISMFCSEITLKWQQSVRDRKKDKPEAMHG